MKRILNTLCPAVLTVLLIYLMRGGKDILLGLYFVFPAMYVLIGLIHSKQKADFFLCLLFTSMAFLIPVNAWFHMGTCIDLAVIYIALACISWWTKKKIAKKRA